MPDICMCQDEECQRKEKCWRFSAPWSYRQAVYSESPRKGDECEYFWDNSGRNNREPTITKTRTP